MAPRLPARCWAPLHRSATTSSTTITSYSPATCPPSATTSSALLASIQGAVPHPSIRPTFPLLPQQASGLAGTQQIRGKKYGWTTLDERARTLQLKYNAMTPQLPDLTTTAQAAQERRKHSTPLRTGVLATKKGMTGYYTHNGKRFPCTVLQMDQCQVVAHKTVEKHGYNAVQIGCGEKKADNVTAPLLGYFEAKGVPPKAHLVEFEVRGAAGLTPAVGVQLMPDWFHKGQWVDVRANSRGMGFEGGMKRHGFSGQEASHGNSKNHRTIGSAGASQGSGSRVLPGKKMPGRMGNERVTVQNLPILRVDNDLGIIVVKGCVAGPKGALVQIQDAVKKPPPPQEFIDKMNKVLMDRFPNAAADLEKARKTHLALKELRREGRIEEVLKRGLREGKGILADKVAPVEVEAA
ncbi:translation protein [Coniella lustricola]|uniref:Large ribosomal subunit protein uL3m n=1 Tax=Coniella lustricola TaxID=2025994 RepID=A0A2T2ZZZ0_9PEZI|nr:translation protein [Coniella lustricola]